MTSHPESINFNNNIHTLNPTRCLVVPRSHSNNCYVIIVTGGASGDGCVVSSLKTTIRQW